VKEGSKCLVSVGQTVSVHKFFAAVTAVKNPGLINPSVMSIRLYNYSSVVTEITSKSVKGSVAVVKVKVVCPKNGS
jgi:hypothetical protein